MSITNYTELQTAVGRWLQRTDLSTLIPDFIAMAEADFNRSLRLPGQIVREDFDVSGKWTALSGLAAPIADIRSVKITASGVSRALEFIAPEQTHQFYVAGVPKFYTRLGDELGVFPAPDGNYTLEVEYFRTIPALASNSTNFLLTQAPDLYLYRAVMEGAQYLHNPELLARVAPMFDRALSGIKLEGSGKQFGSSAPTIRAG